MSVGEDTDDLRAAASASGGGAAQGRGGGRGQDDVSMPEAPSSPNQDTDDEVLTDGDDEGVDRDEAMDATGGVDSFSGGGGGGGGGGGNAADPFGMAAGTSLMGGMDVVGVAGIAGTIGGGSVVLNGLLNEEPPTPHYARAPGTRRRYNPDKYLPSGRLRPTAEISPAERRNLGSNLVTDVQALRSRRARRRAMTLPHDVEEAELLAAGGGGGGGGGGGDDPSRSAPNAAPAAAAAAINEEGEAAASQQQQQQQQPRRSRRRHSSSPTRFSVERHSGAILEDLMAVMGLNDDDPSPGGNGGSAGSFNPWGESQ